MARSGTPASATAYLFSAAFDLIQTYHQRAVSGGLA
jgi:hypothetical protein